MKIQIITVKSWNIKNAIEFKKQKKEHNILLTSKLSIKQVNEFNPDYIFFPHWSEKIPTEIYEKYKSILFHITDLPFGRGGSPLQNLIIRKIYKTKISAIKVNKNIDSGDIYCKEDFDINEGSADDILKKASDIIFTKMIPYIINNNPESQKQVGEAITFKRRTPDQSNMSNVKFNDVYDFIRMLDGEGYPPAFINIEKLYIIFRKAQKKNGIVTGEFEIYDNRNRT